MNSPRSAPPAGVPEVLLGHQEPRILSVPGAASSAGQEAVELAAHAGLVLDPWQQLSVHHGLGEADDGLWAAFEVVLNVCRQNGKGGIIECRELAGLFLFGERMIIHTSHEFKTSRQSFFRIRDLIDGTPDLRKRVLRIRNSHGEEGIDLKSGAQLLFLARSGGSGRGFSGDLVVMDEAMILGSGPVGALMPTMSARPNPQLWYASSAGIGTPSVQLAILRSRALKGLKAGVPDPSLAYLEWSIDPHVKECPRGCTEHDDRGDPRSWARANPTLGIRIRIEHVAREFRGMEAGAFDTERLGVGDYPAVEEAAWEVVSEQAWTALADPGSQADGVLAFAADVTPERSYASIAVAGRRADGRLHVEVVEHRPGTGWVAGRLTELIAKWSPCAVVIDGAGPAGSLIAALEADGIEVVKPTGREAAQAAGQFYDAVAEEDLRHLDQAPLNAALAGARKRALGEAWAWARNGTSVDISPLVAGTLAAWGHTTRAHIEPEEEVEPWVAYG